MIDDRKNDTPNSSKKKWKKGPSRAEGGRGARRNMKGPDTRGTGNRKKRPPRGQEVIEPKQAAADKRVAAVETSVQVSEGKFRGSPLPEPELNGRVPLDLSDRQEIFSLFGRSVKASRFLDLCSGTGMIAIEALSRGAMLASLVERSSKRCSQIKRNLAALGIKEGHAEVFESEAAPFLKRMGRRRRFWDLVFYDPPFDAHYDEDLRFLTGGAAVRPGGILAIRHHSDMFFPEAIGVLRRTSVRELGGHAVSSYKRVQ